MTVISNKQSKGEWTKDKKYKVLSQMQTALGLSVKIIDDSGFSHWVMTGKTFKING